MCTMELLLCDLHSIFTYGPAFCTSYSFSSRFFTHIITGLMSSKVFVKFPRSGAMVDICQTRFDVMMIDLVTSKHREGERRWWCDNYTNEISRKIQTAML